MAIRPKNNSPRLSGEAVHISLLSETSRGGRREVLLDGRLEVVSWKGVTPNDRLLIEAADQTPGDGILAAMTPSALAALAMHQLRPESAGAYYHQDLFNVRSAENLLRRHDADSVRAFCEPVIPHDPGFTPDIVLLSSRIDDEAGLTIELIHQAHHRLTVGGKLLAAINNPADTWLANQLQKIFGNLTRLGKDKRAIVYSVKKREAVDAESDAARKREMFIQPVEVDFEGQRLAFDTAYGTFSSHRLDDGSRALLASFEPAEPCDAILDLGCGWGGLGILAARKAKVEKLLMIDANARAVEMSLRNLAKHGPAGGEVRLEANAESFLEEANGRKFDAVVSNPPYGTEFRVTELFIQTAHRALRDGGSVWLVGKSNPRMLARTEEVFGNAREIRRWGYQVVTAVKA